MGWSRARLGLLALAGVIAIGTAWYSLVESFTALDALYQAVTTVSTVGFREVNPLDSSGRIFTIGLIFVGVGAMFFTVTAVFEAILEDQVGRIGRRRMQRRIDDLDDHVVVCGYGRVGRTVVPLVADAMGVVVIELDEDRGKAAAEAGFPVIVGDATDDAVLEEAGLSRAKVLV
ncbi:MAG TPA: potassium channel family protein, partial [Acidimicrobiia bacterium]|nr:potassium channel family protein [Acidimicrobiia bacterium]